MSTQATDFKQIQLNTLAQHPSALTADDVARVLNLHKLTVYKLARENRIPGAFRIGTALRFHPRKVAAFIEGGAR